MVVERAFYFIFSMSANHLGGNVLPSLLEMCNTQRIFSNYLTAQVNRAVGVSIPRVVSISLQRSGGYLKVRVRYGNNYNIIIISPRNKYIGLGFCFVFFISSAVKDVRPACTTNA